MDGIIWELKSFDQLTKDNLYAILALRVEVFVVEQNCPYQDLDGKDEQAYHVLGLINNELVATARILPKGIVYDEVSIGRVVTRKAIRGKGVGHELMHQSLAYIRNNLHDDSVRISAQEYLLEFYKDFGFKSTGKEYLEDGIPHVEMLKRVS